MLDFLAEFEGGNSPRSEAISFVCMLRFSCQKCSWHKIPHQSFSPNWLSWERTPSGAVSCTAFYSNSLSFHFAAHSSVDLLPTSQHQYPDLPVSCRLFSISIGIAGPSKP